MDLAAFRVLCVDAFPLSTRRPVIFETLMDLHEKLVALAAPCELWLDGSFLSEKLEPDDLDLTIVFHAYYFDKLDISAQQEIASMHGRKTENGFLHIFNCIQFADDDPRRGASMENYWAELWLVDWEHFLKGFIVVRCGD